MKSHLLAAVAVGAVFVAGSANAQQLRLMTGPQGGSWYPLGGAIQNIVENNVDGVTVQVLPGAGIANVKAVEAGKAQMGFANSVSTVDAIQGNEPFTEKATNVCNVATLYPQYFQVIALKDSGIDTPADLAGKAAAVQPKGNTGEAITAHLLKAIGTNYDALPRVNHGSYTDAVSLMKDGNAEWFTLGTTVPAGAVMDLASARDIKVVPIEGEALEKMQELNPGYKPITIKAGSYPGQDEDVQTIGYATHLIAQCDLDPDVVYNVLKNISEHVGDLSAIAKAMSGATPEDMGRDIGVPLHDGAKKFYDEAGAS
ncbi:C4-dicarboxylate ABC transporter substrate-binding protein [Acuticoccus sediminis]|uniref:C4-dicarboxylate ABC transporter substrate-binding protein n=1 Tax=Acuticoccus sediminis TaxID=2184697 RepID=A0A8B2NLH6_9HYPH|nr:TAXI family TRAP transporter solute-binding subunit [Acuticoccus sediminis]RAH99380.1 C4-dicarboxylate ABC transporter substrate-binding protein [Acuticoccus sediminis]